MGFPGVLNMHGKAGHKGQGKNFSASGGTLTIILLLSRPFCCCFCHFALAPPDLWLIDEWDHRYHLMQQRKERLVKLAERLASVSFWPAISTKHNQFLSPLSAYGDSRLILSLFVCIIPFFLPPFSNTLSSLSVCASGTWLLIQRLGVRTGDSVAMDVDAENSQATGTAAASGSGDLSGLEHRRTLLTEDVLAYLAAADNDEAVNDMAEYLNLFFGDVIEQMHLQNEGTADSAQNLSRRRKRGQRYMTCDRKGG